MPPGEVQIDGGVIERGMAEQHLDGAQVRSCFQQVGRKLWRRVCGEMCFSIPAARVLLLTISVVDILEIFVVCLACANDNRLGQRKPSTAIGVFAFS
jgi:hypothetical protein